MAITRDLTFATIYTDQGIELGDTLTYTTLNDGTTSLTATVAELNTLDGITATTAELNYVDGVTSNLQTQLDAKLPLAGGTMTGNIVMSGAQTVDGRDLSADGTKLDGIESGATADQTASEILTALLTVDGTTSGLDADLLDGQQGSYYAPIASPTFTGTLTYATLNDGTTALTSTVAELNTLDGITATVTELNYTDGVTSNLQTQLDAKAPLASPTLTGTPLAPTAAAATNTTQIATTAFVQTAVSNLVDAAPSTLDTLNELAAALGDDANFSTTVTNSIATKVPLAGGTMTGNLDFGDSVYARFGASQDLQIYHDGTNSYIKEGGTGDLYIQGGNEVFIQNVSGVTYFYGNQSGQSTIGYAGSTKLATTSTGINVTGTVTSDGLTVDGTATITDSGNAVGSNTPLLIKSNNSVATTSYGWDNLTSNYDYIFNVNGALRAKISNIGDISFYDDTGATQAFFWDASAESLGIGTTSPSYPLEVEGSATTNVDIAAFSNSNGVAKHIFGLENVGAGTYTLLDQSNNTAVFFSGHSSDNSYINAGNVGIGTTSPFSKLNVAKAGINAGAITYDDETNNAHLTLVGTDARVRLQMGTYNNDSYAAWIQGSFDNNSGGTGSSGREPLALNPQGGYVSIGTSNPQRELHIYDASSSNAFIAINHTGVGSTSADGMLLGVDSNGDAIIHNYENTAMIFRTNDIERMRIASDGKVIVGTTSAFDNVSYNILQSLGGLATKIDNTAATTQVSFFNPNGRVGYIGTSGTTTSYNTSSDYRLKENVVGLTGAIDRIKQVPVHRFNFIAEPDKTIDGFIAHEVSNVVPEAVTGEKDAVDTDGNIISQGIDQAKLVPLLTAALQEAIAEIENLKTRIEAIENA